LRRLMLRRAHRSLACRRSKLWQCLSLEDWSGQVERSYLEHLPIGRGVGLLGNDRHNRHSVTGLLFTMVYRVTVWVTVCLFVTFDTVTRNVAVFRWTRGGDGWSFAKIETVT